MLRNPDFMRACVLLAVMLPAAGEPLSPSVVREAKGCFRNFVD